MTSFNEADINRAADGKFAAKTTGEARVALDDDARIRRADQLASGDYVAPVVTKSPIPAHTTANIERWWDQNFANAEYDHAEGDRLTMPDDYTPNHTGGRALSGDRRTHRMNYTPSQGVSVRMPSKTSIRRFAAEHHNRTFDVPVSATIDGRNVTGWVRVTKGADGLWYARGVGFPDTRDEMRIAESVSLTLEGQRRSIGVARAGDLAQHRAERVRSDATAVQAEPVSSSWIKDVGWQGGNDNEPGFMVARTKDYVRKDGHVRPGRTYGYDISPEVYAEFAASSSKGTSFNEMIKGQTRRVDVTQCPDCQMFTKTPHNGNCPSVRQSNRQAGEEDRSRYRSRAAALLSSARR